ncbi:hypothetical protein V5O48_012856 [Marasmius crinis-equi]|uniref:Uncharacterized protein n=1 Tax=Marasmius crinis-equi TaxID=585013 RepID=A0ABR3F1N2_9AGAR
MTSYPSHEVVYHPSDAKSLACCVCNYGLEEGKYTWIKSKGYKKHCGSETHNNTVDKQNKRRRVDELEHEQYAELFQSNPVPLATPSIQPLTTHAPAIQTSQLDEGIADTYEHQWDSLTPTDIGQLFPVEPSEEETQQSIRDTMAQETKRFIEDMLHQEIYLQDELNVDVDEAEQIAEDLRQFGLSDTDEVAQKLLTGISPDQDYYPYLNATVCYLDVFDNYNRQRHSEGSMKSVLWLLKKTGAKDVPSYWQFRKIQQEVRDLCGACISDKKSDMGNILSSISLEYLAAHDFANPLVAPHINLYPEDVEERPILEMWQVPNGHWTEVPQDLLPPSVLGNNKRHYIHELAELECGNWLIPQYWITVSKILHAVCLWVSKRAVDHAVQVSVTHNWTRIPISQLKWTHEELLARYTCIQFDESDHSRECASRIPNINRKIDGGEDLFLSWWSPWSNDVSDARSKQYQKHMNIYAHHINLPGQLLQQQYFVHPISTSLHAGSLEQFKPILNQVRWVFVCNNLYISWFIRCSGEVIPIPSRLSMPLPSIYAVCVWDTKVFRSVETVGQAVTEFSRLWKIGTAMALSICLGHPVTFKKYMPVYSSSCAWPVSESKITLKASRPRRQEMDTSKSSQEISAELLAWLRTRTDQPYNPLLDIPYLDVSQDTLVEILHTILLGVEKYSWHNLHSNWNEREQGIFTIHLQSTDVSGLKVPAIHAEYMMQYRNDLIGKHFKTLLQVSVFHLHGLVSGPQFRLVHALGELSPVLWMLEIDDLEVYLKDLTILIDNVLDTFGDIDPAKILIKIKLHVLVDEAFNAVFHLCSVLSNHQAASRDIAQKLADLNCVKHLVSGGYWKLEDGTWVTAGRSVRTLLVESPVLQTHMGWSPPPHWMPRLVHAAPFNRDDTGRCTKTRSYELFGESSMLLASDVCGLNIPHTSRWVKGKTATSFTGDVCTVGNWVVCRYSKDASRTSDHNGAMLGWIEQLYLPEDFGSSGTGLVVLRELTVADCLHFEYKMPILKPREPPSLVLVPSTAIQFQINVQHDCKAASCLEDGVQYRVQERQELEVTRKIVVHRSISTSWYLINTHAFHNAWLIRKLLPWELIRPRRLYQERAKRHEEMGARLAVTQAQKRIETNKKAAATRERKKAEKAAVESTASTSFEPNLARN